MTRAPGGLALGHGRTPSRRALWRRGYLVECPCGAGPAQTISKSRRVPFPPYIPTHLPPKRPIRHDLFIHIVT